MANTYTTIDKTRLDFSGGRPLVLLLGGATHTGKTALAQRLLERHRVPYLPIDHLKMGLLRSGLSDVRVDDDEGLVRLLWPVVREIVKTAVENGQRLIVEGCYIPFGWRADFDGRYLPHIAYRCLVMSRAYILRNFETIVAHENDAEKRLVPCDITPGQLVAANEHSLAQCRKHALDCILIDGEWETAVGAF